MKHCKIPPEWILFILGILCILIGLMGQSCRPQQLVPLPTDDAPQHATTQIEYRDKLIRDTTYVLDSVYIREKADTIFVTRWREKFTERIQTDTCYCLKSDTIRIVRRMYIKAPLTKWQTIKLKFGEVFLIILLLLLAWIIYKLTHK